MLAKYFTQNKSEQLAGGDKHLDYPDLGLLLIRLGLASVFIAHGWSKIQNVDEVMSFFASLGLGVVWVFLVAYIEFLGGILMLFGVFVRKIAVLFAVIMVFSITMVKAVKGFVGGYELELLLLLVSVGMALMGTGKYSLNFKPKQ